MILIKFQLNSHKLISFFRINRLHTFFEIWKKDPEKSTDVSLFQYVVAALFYDSQLCFIRTSST